jgi:hypothetical protein
MRQFTPNQAARHLGVPRDAIERAIRDGDLRQRTFHTTEKKIDEADLLAWADVQDLTPVGIQPGDTFPASRAFNTEGHLTCPVCFSGHVHLALRPDPEQPDALLILISCGDEGPPAHESVLRLAPHKGMVFHSLTYNGEIDPYAGKGGAR